MILQKSENDASWSSRSLPPREALKCWRSWASEALAPLDIDVPDQDRFAASWKSHQLGPIQLVELHATPQRVVHLGARESRHESTFQLVYCVESPIIARVDAKQLLIEAGEFVLLDNTRSYEMQMDDTNTAIDVVIRESQLEHWLPDPTQYLGRVYSGSTKWGLPLGTFLRTAAHEIENAVLPRAVIADQIGTLLALAVGYGPAKSSRHKTQLTQRLLGMIEARHCDPDLRPGEIAKELGISERYLHALLAEAGTTFGCTLTRIRLDRASTLLIDPRYAREQIAEIAWQCGYLDASYFARVFRRHFGVEPREWRITNQRQSPNLSLRRTAS